MFISIATQICLTSFLVHSFVDLTKYLLTKHSEENLFILSERFSQDTLENYFGQQRACGGRSDNPTVQRALNNAGALRIQKSMVLDPARGNLQRKRRSFQNKDEVTINDIDNQRENVTHTKRTSLYDIVM